MTYTKIWMVNKNGTITDLTNIKENFKSLAQDLVKECDWVKNIIVVGKHEWDPQNAHFFYFNEDGKSARKHFEHLLNPIEIYFQYPIEAIIKAIDGEKISRGGE